MTMKVFACRRIGSYSGGLAVVAANSKEEAYKVFHEDERYKFMLDCTDDNGDYTEDPMKCNSDYYRKELWCEIPNLTANVDKPCVIAEHGYTE